MSASQFINNLITKSEPYIIEDTHNIDIFILDNGGQIITISPTHKIIINGTIYYYTLTPNNWIYLYNNVDFDSIFTETNAYTTWYGDHFSFGYSHEFPDILNFHLTSYTFDMRSRQTRRQAIYCDFKISDFISDSKNPKCTARKSNTYLATTFDAEFSPELAYIKDIITFGLTQDSIHVGTDEFLYKGKVYKIHTGPKGGLFIIIPKADGTEKKKRIDKNDVKTSSNGTVAKVLAEVPTISATTTATAAVADATNAANTNFPVLGDSPPHQETLQPLHNTRLSKKEKEKEKETDKAKVVNGGGMYTHKFKKLLEQFVLKFAKNNNFKLHNNTYVFVKQSTHHMVILFNYIMSPTNSKNSHQYILHANTQLINKYMSPGVKNEDFLKKKGIIYV